MSYYISSGKVSSGMIIRDDILHVFPGGTANSTVISSGGSMTISSGAVANSTVVNFRGMINVQSGGMANHTTVKEYGSVYIEDGGVASGITVDYGYLTISSGGVASGITVDSYGHLTISSGGSAAALTLSSDGILCGFSFDRDKYFADISDGLVNISEKVYIVDKNMNVLSGGTISSAWIYSGAVMHVSGTADNNRIDSSGSMRVYSGATANSTKVGFMGVMHVLSGGTANSTGVGVAGSMILSGGTANHTSTGGVMHISRGAAANSTALTASGSMMIFHSGTANHTVMTGNYANRTKMHIFLNGTANHTTVNSCGDIYVSGGTANDTIISSGGCMNISSGGSADGITLFSNGNLLVYSSGTAENITISSGGSLTVSSGGSAVNIDWTPCEGRITVAADAHVTFATSCTGVYLGSNGKLLSHTQTASGKSARGSVFVMADGIADSTTVSGSIFIFSGGVANSTVVKSGIMYIYSGAAANSTAVSSGVMYICSGGMADRITVNSSGILIVSKGGSAKQTEVKSGGRMFVFSSGTVNDLTLSAGGILGGFSFAENKYFSNITNGSAVVADNVCISGSNMDVSGTIDGVTVISSGNMYVESGASANRIAINGGKIYISSGATATGISAQYGAQLSFCVASDTWVQGTYNGSGFETKDGVISGYNIFRGACVDVSSGGVASNVTVSTGGTMNISSGASAAGIVAQSGALLGITVAPDTCIQGTHAGVGFNVNNGYVSNAKIQYLGKLHIASGGVADSTTVSSGGTINISSGGTATNINARSGAYLMLTVAPDTYAQGTYNGIRFKVDNGCASGFRLPGRIYLNISSGGVAIDTYISGNINIYSGGIARKSGAGIFGNINVRSGGIAEGTVIGESGWLNISSGGKHCGSLKIYSGANVSAYQGSIIDFTVAGRSTADTWLINDLYLIHGAPEYTITVENNPDAGTYKLAQGAWGLNGTLTIGNGTVDYGSITVNGDDFVYNGITYSLDKYDGDLTLTVSKRTDDDLDGNGLADTVLVHTRQGYSGAWLSTGTDSLIKWGNLGNVNSQVELIGTGNIYASEGSGSDIFMKIGTTVAAWVMDEGKVKSYKELYTLKSNMNMLGIADFDGDGATDYLLRSTGGDLGYITGYDNSWHYIKGLGKEWKIAAVGDLDGNGTDDVIIRHDAGYTGAYMIGGDGSISWSNLDTLKNDMALIGTGDFNGDGVDDVLLQNKSNGWIGAWLVENGSVDSFIGLCSNKNQIEQIGDFNGDGIDDLRIRTDNGDIGVLYVNSADDTTWQYLQSVGKEWDTSFALIS